MKSFPYLFRTLSYSFILFVASFLISCGEDDNGMEPADQNGTSSFQITGAISSSFDSEAEFTHSISGIGDGFSGISPLNLGNIGQTDNVIVFNITELGNKQGITMGTYNYTTDSNASLQLTAYFIDDTNGYFINPDAGDVNQITILSVTDTQVSGEFELNLEVDGMGSKIKITGTFEAIGETFRF